MSSPLENPMSHRTNLFELRFSFAQRLRVGNSLPYFRFGRFHDRCMFRRFKVRYKLGINRIWKNPGASPSWSVKPEILPSERFTTEIAGPGRNRCYQEWSFFRGGNFSVYKLFFVGQLGIANRIDIDSKSNIAIIVIWLQSDSNSNNKVIFQQITIIN